MVVMIIAPLEARSPYNAVAVDPRIFDPEKAKDLNDPEFKNARQAASIQRDDPDEVEKGANADR